MLSPAAKNLKLLRTRLFLTQEAFGRYFNLTRHKVNSYEIGRAKVTPAVVNQLCKTFDLPVQAFTTIDLEKENAALEGVKLQALEKENEFVSVGSVNEWREKYYTVLEKYNDALEELRRFRKQEE